jgi:hypothetical protein
MWRSSFAAAAPSTHAPTNETDIVTPLTMSTGSPCTSGAPRYNRRTASTNISVVTTSSVPPLIRAAAGMANERRGWVDRSRTLTAINPITNAAESAGSVACGREHSDRMCRQPDDHLCRDERQVETEDDSETPLLTHALLGFVVARFRNSTTRLAAHSLSVAISQPARHPSG